MRAGQNVGVTAPTASDFAAAQQAREAAWLSELATPSYPARREREEPDCGLRTPFQRDRDRIVHCKAFRRLKHKTQVFVAPEGDHYRTRLTHTLEVTGISRTVARALRLNEDLTEAIGLGHDVGHPPFGHIGEDVLDRAGRERFGRGFRHNEHSLRVVSVLEGAQPHRAGARRHPAALERRRRSGDARGQDRPAGGPDRLHQPRHRRRAARRRAGAGGPAGGGDRDPRADRARPGSTRSSTTSSSTPSGPGTSCRARRSAARCSRCARSCSSASTSGRGRAPSTRRSSACCAGCSTTTASTPTSCRRASRRPDRVIDYLAGMTDRFAIRAWTERFVPQGLAL